MHICAYTYTYRHGLTEVAKVCGEYIYIYMHICTYTYRHGLTEVTKVCGEHLRLDGEWRVLEQNNDGLAVVGRGVRSGELEGIRSIHTAIHTEGVRWVRGACGGRGKPVDVQRVVRGRHMLEEGFDHHATACSARGEQ